MQLNPQSPIPTSMSPHSYTQINSQYNHAKSRSYWWDGKKVSYWIKTEDAKAIEGHNSELWRDGHLHVGCTHAINSICYLFMRMWKVMKDNNHADWWIQLQKQWRMGFLGLKQCTEFFWKRNASVLQTNTRCYFFPMANDTDVTM